MPNCGEYEKDIKLAFEKEVLGIYVSGHPLEDYAAVIEKNTTATALDFAIQSETNTCQVKDKELYVIAGMIESITIKTTRKAQQMAFLRVEDLFGSMEVVVFPRVFELYKSFLTEDRKVYIKGRAMVNEEEVKLICDVVVPFENAPKEPWIQFIDKVCYKEQEERLFSILKAYHEEYKGMVPVVIYCKKERAINRLGQQYYVRRDPDLLIALKDAYGEENIRIKEKGIENLR